MIVAILSYLFSENCIKFFRVSRILFAPAGSILAPQVLRKVQDVITHTLMFAKAVPSLHLNIIFLLLICLYEAHLSFLLLLFLYKIKFYGKLIVFLNLYIFKISY